MMLSNCIFSLMKKNPDWNQSKELDVAYCHEIITCVAEIAAKFKKQVFFSNEQCVSYIISNEFGGRNYD